MFNFKKKLAKARTAFATQPLNDPLNPFYVEGLEDRRLMSAGHHGGGGFGGGFDHGGQGSGSITFSLLPTAVQTGLTSLAGTDGVAAPTSTTKVQLGNANGVETYTVDVTSTGTDTRLTVDATGAAVTAPTRSTTTFGAVSNAAVTNELTAIASGLGLTAPTSTTGVDVSTPASGVAVYTVHLSGSSSTYGRGVSISVDANGNPVGNERVPLGTLSSTVQSGLTTNAPSGATALTTSSLVDVKTVDGVTLYSATYASTGTRTTVTVNASGALTSLPTSTTTTFGALPSAAATELQAIATADNAGTIASTQSVAEYDELNGTVLYTVKLTATGTSTSGSTYTYPVTITVDANGNPTVGPAGGDHGGGGGGGGGRHH